MTHALCTSQAQSRPLATSAAGESCGSAGRRGKRDRRERLAAAGCPTAAACTGNARMHAAPPSARPSGASASEVTGGPADGRTTAAGTTAGRSAAGDRPTSSGTWPCACGAAAASEVQRRAALGCSGAQDNRSARSFSVPGNRGATSVATSRATSLSPLTEASVGTSPPFLTDAFVVTLRDGGPYGACP